MKHCCTPSLNNSEVPTSHLEVELDPFCLSFCPAVVLYSPPPIYSSFEPPVPTLPGYGPDQNVVLHGGPSERTGCHSDRRGGYRALSDPHYAGEGKQGSPGSLSPRLS